MTNKDYKKGNVLILRDEDIAIKCSETKESQVNGNSNVITLEKNTLIQFEKNDRRERNVESEYTAFFARLITSQKDMPSGQILYLLKINTQLYVKSVLLDKPKMPTI